MLSLFSLFFPQSARAAMEIHRGETQKRHKLPLTSGRVSNIIYLNYSSTTFGNAPGKGEVYIATYAPVLFLFIKTQLADSIFTLLMFISSKLQLSSGSFHRCPRGCWDTARAFGGEPLKSDAAKSRIRGARHAV